MAADSFLRLLQFSDGLFPAGCYAHSLGLETLAQSGRVQSEADAAAFLRAHLQSAAAPTDVVAALCARKYALAGDLDAILRLDSWLDALKPAAELRDASRQMGRQTLRILRALSSDAQRQGQSGSPSKPFAGRAFEADLRRDVVIPSEANAHAHQLEAAPLGEVEGPAFSFTQSQPPLRHTAAPASGALAPEEEIAAFIARYADAVETAAAPGHHAVVFGLAAAAFDWPARETASAFLYAGSAMIVGAALRLLPLGQLAGQRILAGAGSLIGPLTESILGKNESDMHSFTPELEIAAMRHEALEARLFRS